MNYLVPVIITLIYILGNVYVFQRIWTIIPPSPIATIGLIVIATLVIGALILTFVAGEKLPVALTSLLHIVGTSWMIILLYLFMIFLFQDIIGLANKVFHFMPSDALTRYTKDNWVGLAFIIGFVSLFMFSGYLKYQWNVRVPLTISLNKGVDSLANEKLRIVAISDLHLGYGIGKKELEGWINEINKEEPDVVLIAGDIIDNSTRPLWAGDVASAFKKIDAKHGVYACLGNHEHIMNLRESIKFIEATGIKLLKDSVIELNDNIYIVGRDDRWNKRRKSVNDLLAPLDKEKAIIVLDHQPFGLDEAAENGVDLQISGHTHKGQVWPISMLTKSIYEMDYGYKQKGNSHFVVSSGIGVWGGKFRIGTQSEYWVIDIEGV